MKMSNRDWVLLLILSLLWGGAFFFAAIAVKQVPPLTVVLCRVGIAAAVLFVYLHLKGEKFALTKPMLVAFFSMGILNNLIPFSLLFWAQTSIPSGLASILNAATPIFSIIIGHFCLSDEKMEIKKLAGVILGLFGVVVLVGGNAMSGVNLSTWGIIACIGAALSYGFASVYGRRFKSMGLSSGTVALGQLSATTCMMIPIAMVFDQPWMLDLPDTNTILAIIALATISTALAYLIFFQLLATAGAANVSLVTLLIPASAIILGTTFLGEQLETRHLIGLGLILAGLIAIDGRLGKLIRGR